MSRRGRIRAWWVACLAWAAGVWLAHAGWLDWPGTRDFFNSAFSTALLGSLAGAVGGAWGIQMLGERAKARDDALKELRGLNSAISSTFNTLSILLGFKNQQVQKLVTDYEEQRLQAHLTLNWNKLAPTPSPLVVQADLKHLNAPFLMLDQLRNTLENQLQYSGRAMHTFMMLAQYVRTMEAVVARREHCVEVFKQLARTEGQNQTPALFYKYYGFKRDGAEDRIYFDCIHNLSESLDGAIFASSFLLRLFQEHGDNQRREFEYRFGDEAPKLNRVYFDKAINNGLIPSDDEYAEWLSGVCGPDDQRPPELRKSPRATPAEQEGSQA